MLVWFYGEILWFWLHLIIFFSMRTSEETSFTMVFCQKNSTSLSNFTCSHGKGPDRNCASPIKWCKWPVWICWIYFRHPMGSLEVLWCQFFIDQSQNFLHLSKSKLKMLLFQPIVAKSALIDLFIIFIENRSLAPHNEEKCINIILKSISTSTDVKQDLSMK